MFGQHSRLLVISDDKPVHIDPLKSSFAISPAGWTIYPMIFQKPPE